VAAEAAGTSTDIATEDGDSGAPMIRYLSGKLNVVGIVSTGSTVVPCQFNVKKAKCYQTVYYTSMREIRNGVPARDSRDRLIRHSQHNRRGHPG
jgi:hypothetical protein